MLILLRLAPFSRGLFLSLALMSTFSPSFLAAFSVVTTNLSFHLPLRTPLSNFVLLIHPGLRDSISGLVRSVRVLMKSQLDIVKVQRLVSEWCFR